MNSKMTLTLLTTLILFNCGTVSQKEEKENLTDKFELVKSDSTLKTGWYYIDNKAGLKRQLDKDTTWYLINPIPIVTAKNVIEMEIYESNFGDLGLSMQLDSDGTDLWSEATEKATTGRLAFVLNDKLLHAPIVNSQITNGMTALNTGNYSRQELEKIVKEIERGRE
jgi:preprotein translocase subunit SecD